MHLSFIFTLLCKNWKRFIILSDVVAKITELWEAKLFDSLILINMMLGISVVCEVRAIFNKRGCWNNRVVGGKFPEN